MGLPAAYDTLRLPAIAAPMFPTSAPDLVVETCNPGVIRAFPALNQRSTQGFADWPRERTARFDKGAAQLCACLITE